MKLVLPLHDIIFPYLGEEEKLTVLTGKGRCHVCGRSHRSQKAWERCADRRTNKYYTSMPNIFIERRYVLVEEWALMFTGLLENIPAFLITKSPGNIVICVVPTQKIPEIRESLKNRIEAIRKKVRSHAKRVMLEKVVPLVDLPWDPLGDPTGLEPEDIAGRYLIQNLIGSDPPIRRKTINKRREWIFKKNSDFARRANLESIDKVDLSLAMNGFLKWISSTILPPKKDLYEHLDIWVTPERGVAIIRRENTGFTADKIVEMFYIDLVNMKLLDSRTFGKEKGSQTKLPV